MMDTFQILADPTRRYLIGALRHGERTVNDLAQQVEINQPGVSKQLRILYEAGFVDVRQERQRRFYSLRPEPFREIEAWINDYRHVWEARFDKLAAHIAKKKKRN
ncbi:MAG: Transcriptional regulator, ArsR family protein [bacterium]|nr:Transcriptional regulator, ArsR family protein [bacterium]